MFLNICYWEKLTFSKLCWESKFLWKKIWRNALALKKCKLYSGKPLFWHYYLQLSFVYKTVSQISFKLLCLIDRRLLSEFLRKLGWFRGHNDRFPKYLQKSETPFCGWRSTDNNDINIFLSLENLYTFLLAKEKTWKIILTLVNYHKILQKNKLCHSKQQ